MLAVGRSSFNPTDRDGFQLGVVRCSLWVDLVSVRLVETGFCELLSDVLCGYTGTIGESGSIRFAVMGFNGIC